MIICKTKLITTIKIAIDKPITMEIFLSEKKYAQILALTGFAAVPPMNSPS